MKKYPFNDIKLYKKKLVKLLKLILNNLLRTASYLL